jgi:hypothetical protein
MLKLIGTAYKRDDFTTKEFFDYWRDVHAPISAKSGPLREAQRHVLAREGARVHAAADHRAGLADAAGLSGLSSRSRYATRSVPRAHSK